MAARETAFRPVVCSLADMVGEAHVGAVCEARAFLVGGDARGLLAIAHEAVEFYPASLQARLRELLPRVGSRVVAGAAGAAGASSRAFTGNSKPGLAPLSAMGYLRVGEDGRLCFRSEERRVGKECRSRWSPYH